MMNGHNNLLPNNDHEGRSNGTNTNTSESQRVTAAENKEETETERMEMRLHSVLQRNPRRLQGEDLQRWRDDAMGMTVELPRFLLRGDQQENHQQQSSDSTWSYDDISIVVLKNQLEFLEFCFSLKRNNPNIHKVEIAPIDTYGGDHGHIYAHRGTIYTFHAGRLRCLGNGMLRNTRITELIVDVAIMYDERHDIQRAAALLEFVRTSTALRKVRLHRDLSHVWSPETTNAANLLAGFILDAIASNASIQELDIASSYPIDAFRTLMSTTTSLKALHIHCEDFHEIEHNDHRSHLLEAMATNRSIDHLSLTVGYNGWEWLEKILQHMSSGPAKVRKLKLDMCERLPPAFYSLMRTTSLQTLELGCDWISLSFEDQSMSMLHGALASNKSIENLKLIVWEEFDFEIGNDILLYLHNGPSTLQRFAVKSRNKDFNAMRQYLCRSTPVLQHLELEECFMDERSVNALEEGLQGRQGFTQLELKSCWLSREAMNELVQFMATRAKCHNLERRQVSESWLLSEDPKLVAAMHSPPETKVYPYNNMDYMNVSMLNTSLSSESSGISSYHPESAYFISLSVQACPYGIVPIYCDVLMETLETSSVLCLQLSHLRHLDSLELALGLPRLLSLSALHLINIQDDVLPTTILNGLRHNGSLIVTSFLTDGQRPFFQDRQERNIVQSYCQRNRILSEMILRKMALHVDCFVDVEDNSCTNNDQLVLLPKLFQVAKAIPLTKSRFMLVALWASEETIGPQREQLFL